MTAQHPRPVVALEALREEDAATLHAWRSDSAVKNGALSYPFLTSLEDERQWIRSFAPRGIPQNICLGVRDLHSDELYGYCQLRRIDWIARVAELGIVIGAKKARGRGVGTAALASMMEHAIESLSLRRLWLRVAEPNIAAIRLYEAAGFRQEGRLVRHAHFNGELHDVLVYGWEATHGTAPLEPLP